MTLVRYTRHCPLYIGITPDELYDRYRIKLYHHRPRGEARRLHCLLRDDETGAAIGLLGRTAAGIDVIVRGGATIKQADSALRKAWDAMVRDDEASIANLAGPEPEAPHPDIRPAALPK